MRNLLLFAPFAGLAMPPMAARGARRRCNFANDVMPLLSRAGCNAGACHAKPAGQAGFKLSVFAYDPKSDYRAIVKTPAAGGCFPPRRRRACC